MSVHFYLNSRTSYPTSRPVSLRLVVRRHRKHSLTVTLPVHIQPRHWSTTRHRLKPSAPGATELNARLEGLRTYAESLILDGLADDALREHLLVKVGRSYAVEAEAVPTVLDLFDAFLDHKRARARASTVRVYEGLKNHLTAYVPEGQTPDAIGATWLEDLMTYLLGQGLGNATINKLTVRAHGFLGWLQQRGHLTSVPDAPKLPTARNDALYLTREELGRLIGLDLSDTSAGVQAARDLFVVASVTGQRFSDVGAMTWSDVRGDADAMTWHLHVKKTNVTVRVPLLGSARRIIEARREAGERYPVPRLSNQAANRYIKDVAKEAQINAPVTEVVLIGGERKKQTRPKWECLSMHASRKTFITLGLDDALDADDLLGLTHEDLTSLRRYKGRDDKALRVKMTQAFGGL